MWHRVGRSKFTEISKVLFASETSVNLKFTYLFIFNGAFSFSDYIASNERMIVNNGFERMWKEVVAA